MGLRTPSFKDIWIQITISQIYLGMNNGMNLRKSSNLNHTTNHGTSHCHMFSGQICRMEINPSHPANRRDCWFRRFSYLSSLMVTMLQFKLLFLKCQSLLTNVVWWLLSMFPPAPLQSKVVWWIDGSCLFLLIMGTSVVVGTWLSTRTRTRGCPQVISVGVWRFEGSASTWVRYVYQKAEFMRYQPTELS